LNEGQFLPLFQKKIVLMISVLLEPGWHGAANAPAAAIEDHDCRTFL
jgi:hypothetical protein